MKYQGVKIFRLDFEYPKDRSVDTTIKNVSINQFYSVATVTAVNFDAASSSYPPKSINIFVKCANELDDFAGSPDTI